MIVRCGGSAVRDTNGAPARPPVSRWARNALSAPTTLRWLATTTWRRRIPVSPVHPTKNGSLTPQEIVAGSNRSVWWQCSLGHEWCAKVVDRTRGTNGCPYCANQKVLKGFNDLATTHPRIAAQWYPTLNGKLTPEMVTAGSTHKVWWICPEGHVWRTAVYNRAGRNKQTGCPVCAGNIRVKYRQRYYKDCFAENSDRTSSQEAIL